MDENGQWLSIMEYCLERKKSISTVRRYIKSNLVKFKEVNGKYFIWYHAHAPKKDLMEDKLMHLKMDNNRLANDNFRLMNENNELKLILTSQQRENFNSIRNSNSVQNETNEHLKS